MPASEDRAISDFPIASSLTNRALALLSAPDGQGGYNSVHAELNEIGHTILETEYTQDLDTTDKTIIGAINEQQSVIGYSYDEYDATTAYAKDDLCIYNNKLYKAKQATTGNLPTNTTYWEQTSIADEIGRIDTALGVVGHNIAKEYDPTHTYSLGDLVIYENQFYKSNANNATGTWDSTKWNEVTVASELTNIVVKRTLTETTSGNGNVVNYIDVANGIIVSAICTSQEALVIPFMNSLGTMYSFHVISPLSAHGVVANTSVTIDFYMIPNRRII